MLIFLISRGYPSKKDPQWGCFEKDQAEALTQLGHNVVMLSCDTRFRMYWRKIGIQRVNSNNVVSYTMFLFPTAILEKLVGKHFTQKIVAWQYNCIYQKAVQEFGQPDILYSHYLFISYFAVKLSELYHIPVVGIEHWSRLNERPLVHSIFRMGECTYSHLDALVAVSESLKNSIFESFHKDNSYVVHNMVGNEFRYNVSQTQPILRIVSTGSLVYRKGFDLLIDALHKIGNFIGDWALNIVGEGPERDALQARIDGLHLSERIHLLGKKNKVEIGQLLNESDVFILPSRNENFSVAVLEALACGLPVIASICGGIRECIDEKNGILFPVDDVEALAHAIEYMATNYHQYNRQVIADDCQARFSPPVIAKQLETIFENTISIYKQNNATK